MTPTERLLKWVEIVTWPVANYGPANDEMICVRASNLYNLLQAHDALSAPTREPVSLLTRLICDAAKSGEEQS